jgi:hypothetical protein
MMLGGLGNALGSQNLQGMNRNNFNQQGIGQFLSPLISAINRDYSQDVVQPYVEQVENLTNSTFPNFNVNSGMGTPSFQPESGIFPQAPSVTPPLGQMADQYDPDLRAKYLKDMLPGGVGAGLFGLIGR